MTTFEHFVRFVNGRTEWRWFSVDGTVVSPIFRSWGASYAWAKHRGIINEHLPQRIIIRKQPKRKKKLRLTGQRN